MGVQITIRDVPEEVRDEIAARAVMERKSMQEYLRLELIRWASNPTVAQWLDQVRRRKRLTETHLEAGDILGARDTDRR